MSGPVERDGVKGRPFTSPPPRHVSVIEKVEEVGVSGAARSFGHSHQWVQNILKRWRPDLIGKSVASFVVPRSPGYNHPPEIINFARICWDSGASITAIAAHLTREGYPITRNGVGGIAHRNNFPARPSPIKRG
jgi:hypothetical protein